MREREEIREGKGKEGEKEVGGEEGRKRGGSEGRTSC